ncbi:MAG TPA: VWA domain-containing protein, partial [Gemmataceae bacterium]|nr:VWA domain-containing protein [Gemmataceae bacterium]
METVIKREVEDPFLQRMKEPLVLFGQPCPDWMWVALVVGIVAVGAFYAAWLYIRERRSIVQNEGGGMKLLRTLLFPLFLLGGLRPFHKAAAQGAYFWMLLLWLLRVSVYALLALVFLLPSRQHFYTTQTERTSRVVLLYDVSLSMKEARDGLPTKGGSLKDVPSRQDKVLEFLTSHDVQFIERLETQGRPVVMHRFAQQADPDYRWVQRDSEGKAVHFWPSKEAEPFRRPSAPQRGAPTETPGVPLTPDHWKSWLFPVTEMPMPAGWNAQDGPGKELLRQLKANRDLTVKFFEGTALGDALLDVLRREQGGQVQGIVVFTDGRRTEGSDKSMKDAVEAAKAADIPIFVVGVGKEIPKVSIDIVDLRVPPLIRPEDKFRVVVTVNGHDMPVNEPFELFLDITRKGETKDKKEITKDIELVGLDEKGNLLEDKKLTLKPKPKKDDGVTILDGEHKGKSGVILSDGMAPDGTVQVRVGDKEFAIPATKVQVALTLRASKHSKDNWLKPPQDQKPPTFKQGNPPNAQIEFELDAATLAHIVRGTSKLPEDFVKVGLFPDDATELHIRARVPKDDRELMDAKEHFSDAEKMAVQKRPLRVLLFASAALREYQFVQNLLVREMEKGRADVCIHLQQIPMGEKRSGIVQNVDPERILDEFPIKRKAAPGEKERYKALSSYDVIIAFDADWTQLSKEQLKMVNEWVEKDGGGLIFVAGDLNTLELARPVPRGAKADSPPLLYIRDMLPVVLEDSRKSDVDEDERLGGKWRLRFPQATSEMEFMRLDDSDPKEQWKRGWDRFFNEVHDVEDDGKDKIVEVIKPPAEPERGFPTFYPSRAVKQNALVLASFDAPWANLPNSADKQPYLARGPWGDGTCFWIASPDTYMLRTFK